jgi:hypothetical protein
MTKLFRGIRLVSFASLALAAGCGLFGKKEGAADAEAAEAAVAEVAEAAPPPVAAPAAANENDVSRFPDEKKLDNVTATIQRVTNVREIPGIGKVVATLAKGGTVTEIAQRGTFFLVVFDAAGAKKMGWISQDSFTVQLDAGIVQIKCTVPESALISDAPFCGKICAAEVDCPSGQACRGAANKLLTNGAKGDAVRVCTVFGTPRVVAVADAAPPPPPPPAAPACPAGQLLAKDNVCHQSGCRIGTCTNPATPQCVPCKTTTICVAPGQRQLCP